ncbi:MAG: hypothetical protein JWM03_1453 [Rhodocyclales bacterium]|nr:hypothetical protein [Rhodocyclales bacterium]MDB5888581.1 hypothetical protein [Rhodocyclales bacterium]
MNDTNQNGNIAADQDSPLQSAASREELKAAFSPDTPDEVRERVLNAVLAVLNGDDDD